MVYVMTVSVLLKQLCNKSDNACYKLLTAIVPTTWNKPGRQHVYRHVRNCLQVCLRLAHFYVRQRGAILLTLEKIENPWYANVVYTMDLSNLMIWILP